MNRSVDKRRVLVVLVVLGVIVLPMVFSLSFIHERLTMLTDSFVYMSGAVSLAEGNGYLNPQGTPQTAWPPGYSVVLVLPTWLAGQSVFAYKLTNILFAGLATGVWLLVLWRLTSPLRAALVMMLVAVSFPWIYFTHMVCSDIVFTLLVACFLLGMLLHRDGNRAGGLVLMTVSAMFAPLVRMAGVTLLPVWAIVVLELDRFSSWWRGSTRWRFLLSRVAMGVVLVLPLALWLGRNILISGEPTLPPTGVSPEYRASLAKLGISEFTFLTRLWINIRGYAHILVLPGQSGIAKIGLLPLYVRIVCWTLTALLVAGWGKAIFGRQRRAAFAFAAYAGMLLVHNWYDLRYLLPVLPLYLLWIIEGAEAVVALPVRLVPVCRRFFDRVSLPALVNTGVAALVALSFAFSAMGPQGKRLRSRTYEGATARLHEACCFIRDDPAPGAVLAAGGPGFIRLWTRRQVVSSLSLLNAEAQLKSLEIPEEVRFLILDESDFVDYRRCHLDPLVGRNRDRLEAVFRKENTIVYRVQPKAESTSLP